MYLNHKTKQSKNIFSILAVLALAVFGLTFSAGSASATTISSAYTFYTEVEKTCQKI